VHNGAPLPIAAKRKWRLRSGVPYLYVAPFFIVFFAFFAYPLAYSFYVSLHRWAGIGPMKAVGWDNYTFALGNDFFWSSIRTTGLMWLMALPLGTLLSMVIAVAWNNASFRGRNIAIVMYLMPAVVSIVAISVVFRILYDPSAGPIDTVITGLGLPAVPWLSSEGWARVALGIVRLWESIGLGALFYFASLQGISAEIYDASAVDGCTPVRQFLSITVPLLARTTLFLTVINTLQVFSMFAEPQLVTNQGGPNNATTTVGFYLFTLVQNLDLGTASAVSFLMTVGMMIVSILLFLTARRWMSD
jgi:ABC-type sugar transport system permease subunit